MRAASAFLTRGMRTKVEGNTMTWSMPDASMSRRRTWGSRWLALRPTSRSQRGSLGGMDPRIFLFIPGCQPCPG